ncbi:MAG: DNA repair protein RecO [Acidimicrobiia bacterium]|nr:DNA repair protein RecO [Acidimicrobiia bacterium]
MRLRSDTAVVLRTYKLGEADRIVVLLTADHGKVRAVAKGVRKTRSRFGGRLEPLTHVTVQLHEGRNLDVITQAETIDTFRTIRDDLGRLGRAVAMLEAADHLSMEGEPTPELFRMLVGALRSLGENDSALVASAFLLKALALEGFRPQVEGCVACGAIEDLVAFDAGSGGLLCRPHRRGGAISPEAITLLGDILGGRLAAALATPRGPATGEVDRVATALFEHHIERRLRSVAVLDAG